MTKLPTGMLVLIFVILGVQLALMISTAISNRRWLKQIREQQKGLQESLGSVHNTLEMVRDTLHRVRRISDDEVIFKPRQSTNTLGLQRKGGEYDAPARTDSQPRRA